MEKSLVTVNMAMRWEMRLKKSSHAKMMNHNENPPKMPKIQAFQNIFRAIEHVMGDYWRKLQHINFLQLLFLVNKVASTSVLITTNKQKITQFHSWVNSFSIVLKSKLSSLIAQVKVSLKRTKYSPCMVLAHAFVAISNT